MAGELLLINPRKRKSKAKRAAPRRAKRRARRAPVVMSNPAPRRRRSRLSALKTRVKRAGRKYRRNPSTRINLNSITTMAKNAAIGAAGAVAVDVGFGYLKGYLPDAMQSPTDATGALNPMYFLAKGGLAVLGGVLGAKVTKHAGAMAAGSLTVSTYEILRSFVPASVSLGQYVNPAQVMRRTPPRAVPMARAAGGMSGYKSPAESLYMGQFVS